MKQFNVYENPSGMKEAVKQGWSWPGFFFNWIWCFVKKMSGLGFGVLGAYFGIGILSGIVLVYAKREDTMRGKPALFLVLSVMLGCDVLDTSISVTYEVTGSANAVDVTYENDDGGTSQEGEVPVPWSYTFTGEPGDFVYISAQNQGESGSVTATIITDGDTFKTSTSSGAYVIATASGSL